MILNSNLTFKVLNISNSRSGPFENWRKEDEDDFIIVFLVTNLNVGSHYKNVIRVGEPNIARIAS